MIVNELVYIYEHALPKNPIMLSHTEALEYFERLLMQGNILTYVKGRELCGFIEYWRISYEQFGRLCCNWTLAHDEDILNGNIALITRMWIKPSDRNSEAFDMLAAMFLTKNKDCTHFAAFQYKKTHKPIQVYSREEILKHFK